MAKQNKIIVLADFILKKHGSNSTHNSAGNSSKREAIQELQKLLGFDELNLWYFLALYQRRTETERSDPLWIHVPGEDAPEKLVAYPTAIAPPEMLAKLPYVEHSALLKSPNNYENVAKRATLWIKKMQAGSGTSMTRNTYLSRVSGGPQCAGATPTPVSAVADSPGDPGPTSGPKPSVGAKGTDLFIDLPNAPGQSICLAEAQILQAVQDARAGKFKAIILHDLVSTETESSITAIWNKPSLPDPSRSYSELIELIGGSQGSLRRSGRSVQAFLPTLDETGQFSFNRQSPGGHALFALDALRAAYLDQALPDTGDSPLVSSIGNGEDLSSTPDPEMVGWMVSHNIPIAMVTTEKTPNDLKGGQIALIKRADDSTYATIIEQAQAKESGQLELFERLGLDVKRGDQIAFFNTNMAIFNYDVLRPKLRQLVADIGEEAFLAIVAPDLIINTKEQIDSDGVTRKYQQLEGAMGSSLLNLDRYWRTRQGEPLVHFINVDQRERTRFFSPIKTAFDFFMQFHSDLFELDPIAMRLTHRRPGSIPSILLKDSATQDKYYQDVQSVLESFEGTSLIELRSLTIDGQVAIRNSILRGSVSIRYTGTGRFDLAEYSLKNPHLLPREQGRLVLANVQLEIDGQNRVQLTQFN